MKLYTSGRARLATGQYIHDEHTEPDQLKYNIYAMNTSYRTWPATVKCIHDEHVWQNMAH